MPSGRNTCAPISYLPPRRQKFVRSFSTTPISASSCTIQEIHSSFLCQYPNCEAAGRAVGHRAAPAVAQPTPLLALVVSGMNDVLNSRRILGAGGSSSAICMSAIESTYRRCRSNPSTFSASLSGRRSLGKLVRVPRAPPGSAGRGCEPGLRQGDRTNLSERRPCADPTGFAIARRG
jgi:hypothetical protein